MNTFELTSKNVHEFVALQPWDQRSIVEDLRMAQANKELISIQLQEFDGELCLYGVYTKTYQDAANYDRNGGLWLYYHPQDVISAIKEITTINPQLVKLLSNRIK